MWKLLALSLLALAMGACASVPALRMTPGTPPPDVTVRDAQWVTLEDASERRYLTAILRPEGSGPFPAVVILHGADGLAARYLEVAEELAHAGFLVVAGCWQEGMARTPGNAACAGAPREGAWIADPAVNSGKTLVAAAKTLPDAQPDHVGLYGISRGGHAALWAAGTGADVQAVVVDAPAHRPLIRPTPRSTLEVVGRVTVPVLILHGTADIAIPVEQSKEYESAARAIGLPVTAVYFDGIAHMPSVQPGSQSEARRLAIEFLREHLGNVPAR